MKSVDKSSAGYGIGRSVMSKHDGPPDPVTPHLPKSGSALPFHRLSVEPADNGVTVEHMPVDPKHGGGDYSKSSKKVFNSMTEAHAHIGKCMGLGGGN